MTDFDCQMIADSISDNGKRIASLQVTLPLIVQNEMLTHRRFSRGSASSRAIPVKKMIKSVYDSPFIPDKWFHNQKGMQPGGEITDPYQIDMCRSAWLRSRDAAVLEAEYLAVECDVAKEISNRLLGPFFWSTMIITSTHWCNFFALRCHPMAQRQIRIIAEMMRERIFMSEPTLVISGGIHAPYVTDTDWVDIVALNEFTHDKDNAFKISTGRVARVSYVNQDGKREISSDIDLHDRLIDQTPKHAGPLEHCAIALPNAYECSGNFMGWRQYRKMLPDETVNTYTYKGKTMTDFPTLPVPKE